MFLDILQIEFFRDGSRFMLSELGSDIGVWIFGTLFLSVFTSVPAFVGGFLLTMVLNKWANKGRLSLSKSIFISSIWGFIVAIGILAVGLPFFICIGSHGFCDQDPIGYLSQAIEGFPWSIHLFRILSVLVIALISGGMTGGQLFFSLKNQTLEPEKVSTS